MATVLWSKAAHGALYTVGRYGGWRNDNLHCPPPQQLFDKWYVLVPPLHFTSARNQRDFQLEKIDVTDPNSNNIFSTRTGHMSPTSFSYTAGSRKLQSGL